MDLMEFISPEEVNHPVRGHLRHLGDTLQRLNNWTVEYKKYIKFNLIYNGEQQNHFLYPIHEAMQLL